MSNKNNYNREALIELLLKANLKCHATSCEDDEVCPYEDHREDHPNINCKHLLTADYLLSHHVTVLPCNPGDTVWFIYNNYVMDGTVGNITISKSGVMVDVFYYPFPDLIDIVGFTLDDFNIKVFLDREAATNKLKGNK